MPALFRVFLRRRAVARLSRPERMYSGHGSTHSARLSWMRTLYAREETMAMRQPPEERFYDPTDLNPDAPRLYVLRNGDAWELQDEYGDVLSTHPTQRDALDAAHDRSAIRFCEILVRGSNGRVEWCAEQSAAMRDAMEYWRQKRLAQREAAD